MTIETIQKIKEVGLFDELKLAMEVIVEETIKPQIEWDVKELNCYGLKYNPEEYIMIHKRWIAKEYEDESNYFKDLDSVSLKNASYNNKIFKYFYTDYSHANYLMEGLEFGCITWNMYDNLKGPWDFEGCDKDDYTKYDEYTNKVKSIDYSCFYGKTPKEILEVLE